MNLKDIRAILPVLFKHRITPRLIGHKGRGKSQTIREYAKENGLDFIDFRLGEMNDAGDLMGLPFLDEKTKTTKFFSPDMLPKGGSGILFLDEMNRANKEVLQAVFELVLDRRIGQYTLPDNWHCVVAENPSTDGYQVTEFHDEAFASRFCQIKVEPTVSEWLEYAEGRKFHSDIVSFIRSDNSMLWGDNSDFSLKVKPDGRAWEFFDRVYKENIPANLKNELGQGLVGTAAIASFINSIKTSVVEISGEDIVNNFSEVVPTIDKIKNSHDVLNKVNEKVEVYMKTLTSLTEEQEKNVKNYIMHIPKDVAYSLCLKLIELESFLTTKSDNTCGLANDDEIVSYFEKDIEEIKKMRENVAR